MSIVSKLRNLKNNENGQFAILFSLLSLPLLAAAGLAIDYSYAVQVRVRLRAANDAAALYAALQYNKTGELPAEEKVHTLLDTDFKKSDTELNPTISQMTMSGQVLTLVTEVDAPVYIMGIFGHQKTRVTATSAVTLGQDTHLQIALALDNTYSMTKDAGVSADEIDPDGEMLPPGTTLVTRIDALKVAALRFNNTILNNVNLRDRSSIAIVPFARYVNVGLANRHAPWMSVPDDSGPTGQQCYQTPEIIGYGTCKDQTWDNDGVPVHYNYCPPIYGPNLVQECYTTGASSWSGCVGSRQEPMNLKDAYSGSKFPGLMDTWCSKEILPLTNDPVKVANHIASLWADDFTFIPEGVMWGWRVLTKAAPFESDDAAAAGKTLRKIMVLMTDGDNQAMSDLPSAPTHHVLTTGMDAAYLESEVARANDVTRDACAAAKNAGIEMYVVSFGTDIGAAAKQMLENCATDPTHYFDATNAKKLIEAFDSIAFRVSATYLSN